LDEEFPSWLEVWTLMKDVKRDEIFKVFWEKWQIMRQRKKDEHQGVPTPNSTLAAINREKEIKSRVVIYLAR